MTEERIIESANNIAVQRLLARLLCRSSDYDASEIAGATVKVEPSRHRTGIPADAACRRYVITHVGEGWSMVVRAVWRGNRLYEPTAVHVRVEHLWDDDGRHGDDEIAVAVAVNEWLRGLPL